MHLAFAISTLQGGGAERVATILTAGWHARGHRVTIITLDDAPSAYELDPGVERLGLGLMTARGSTLRRVQLAFRRPRAVRGALRELQPDVVVSFIDALNLIVLLATVGSSVPVVVSERIDPRHHRVPRTWRILRWLLYRRAASIVVQTEAVRPWAHAHAGRDASVAVLPNPVDVGKPPSDKVRTHPRRILAAGRLAPQKGFDVLVAAFGAVAPSHPEVLLVIHGEGPERELLEAQVHRLGLAGRVLLPGWHSGLKEELRQADVFVLSSRFEGFPNVLVEAMAAGTPVISTECPSGPGEIVRHGLNGSLVPPDDAEALARELDRLLRDTARRQSYRDHGYATAMTYDAATVAASWEELLESVRAGHATGRWNRNSLQPSPAVVRRRTRSKPRAR